MIDRLDCLDLLEYAPIDLSRVRKSQAELDTEALDRWAEVSAWLEASGAYTPSLAGEVYGIVRRLWVPYGAAYADHLTPLGVELMTYLDATQEAQLVSLRNQVAQHAAGVAWHWTADQKELLAQIPTMTYYQLWDMIAWPRPGYLVVAMTRFYDLWLRFRGY